MKESQTRKDIIDIKLIAAGWNLSDQVRIYPIKAVVEWKMIFRLIELTGNSENPDSNKGEEIINHQ